VEAPSQAEEALRNEKAAGRKVGSKLNDKAVKRARERPNIVDFRKRTGRMKIKRMACRRGKEWKSVIVEP